jgi:hypothetical protein
MTYVIAVLAGAAGAIVGWAIAVYVGGLLGMPEMASRWTPALSGLGAIGGAVGCILAVAATFRFQGGHKRFWPLALRSIAIVLALALLALGGVRGRQLAFDHLGINEPEPKLDFEIRLPARFPVPPTRSEFQIALYTDRNQSLATLDDDWLRQDGDRPVLNGRVSLYFRTSQRNLVLSLPGHPNRIFQLRLAENPSRVENFSAWRQLDFVDDPGTGSARPAGQGDDFEIRYRIERRD